MQAAIVSGVQRLFKERSIKSEFQFAVTEKKSDERSVLKTFSVHTGLIA